MPSDAARATWRSRAAFFASLLPVALPAALLLLAHRLWIRRKGMTGLAAKLSGRGPRRTPGQILVHGVSLGEVNLMRPLVPALEAALRARCLLTTTTETGWARLAELFPGHDRELLPLDLPWAVERFLSRTRPRAIVLLELEVWPQLLYRAAARGIPVWLLNARVSERSFRGYRRGGALLAPCFRGLDLVLAQNGLWGARLRALGAPRVRVCGSMKADMVAPVADDDRRALATAYGLSAHRPLLLLASTSAGEERTILADRLSAWLARGWQVVICPRHPERGGELAELISSLGAPVARSSTAGFRPADGVLIVDQIGKLGGLYAQAAATVGIVVVGGSLGSGRGGQNMLEPAAVAACTVVGWDTRNFPDAMALLRTAGGVVEVTAANLHQTLDALAEDPTRRACLGRAGHAAWAAGRGAVARAVALCATRI